MYISDNGNSRIRKVAASSNIITTFAGTGTAGYSGDGGAATSATFYDPYGIDMDFSDNLYIAEYQNHVIRKITVSTGIVTTVAGIGSAGYNGDSISATSASLYNPVDVQIDDSGNLYIADRYNYRIRKVTVATGVISTVVGTGDLSSISDGSRATAASINAPVTVRIDSDGNLYSCEFNDNGSGNRIRKVTNIATMTSATSTIITTIAGTGTYSYRGDNGSATSATLSFPFDVALDSSGRSDIFYIVFDLGLILLLCIGNVYIADSSNHRIRKVTVATGIITTIVGYTIYGSGGYSGDNGDATSAMLSVPNGVTLDSTGTRIHYLFLLFCDLNAYVNVGNMYIGDAGNNRVRKVTGSTGIIKTIAGTGTGDFSGDGGQATSAALNYPCDIQVDSSGTTTSTPPCFRFIFFFQ